ncbi:MAG: hypothetical protein M3552_15800 [Planctomycetota bacterium]|nr:hypothetical protein [Planctomycetaceae bacterium]MDQ3332092.1 hypothetical protein [Planctomycetota bacterium]
MTLEIRYVSPPPITTVNCLIEINGPIKRRAEVFAGEVPGQIVIRDGNEFLGFRRKPNEDVHIYDVERAVGVRGDLAFDPRILGLSDIMPCDVTVKDCLWYEEDDELTVMGSEGAGEVNLWRVKAIRGDTSSEYWVEEPSFRVHRRITETPFKVTVIESEFDPSDPKLPFPRRVIASRKFKMPAEQADLEWVYTVNELETDVDVPSERFTLASMDLPVNTAVVDYRINRIVGYWDGEGLSEKPAYSGERPVARSEPVIAASDQSEPERHWRRWLLIVANVVVVLGILIFIWWRRR